MIFGSDMANLVLAGRKTQTRRLSCRYQERRVYQVQRGRGKPGVGPITITEIREERLGDISLSDVRREGFRTTAEFQSYWRELHKHWNPDQPVFVISFVKGDHTDQPRLLRESAPAAPTCTAILRDGPRKGKTCGRAFADQDYLSGRPVTVCQCGAKRPAESVEDHGYTARKATAMRGEGEAVPADAQERITKRGELNHVNGYIVQRERLMAVISDIRPFAKDAETVAHLKGIERQLAALDRKMRAAA